MPPSAVELRHVIKRFGRLTAVDDLDLVVPTGLCFGLLGPNGAGKSTTMRLLTGQAVADEGEVCVLGEPMPAASKLVRSRSGMVPQADDLDDELTVGENLAVWARIYGLSTSERGEAVGRGLALARLSDRADTPTRELSGGMRRRLLIARGLIHRPELLLLDEPTVGLDPQVRQGLWGQITRVRDDGATVVITTHYIEEAERLCDRVAIMHRGRVIAEGPPFQLITDTVGREVIEVVGGSQAVADVAAQAEGMGALTRDTGMGIAVLGAEHISGDLAVAGRRRPATLEDVFVVLTGEELT